MMSPLLLLCVLYAGVLAVNAHQKDGLFSFGGLDSLRDPECVPDSYRLPQRVSDIADQCLYQVETGFEDLDALNNELAVLNDPKNQARGGQLGPSVRHFRLGIRECMSEKMGILDDSGEFVTERLEAEISVLGFPEAFEQDVQSASRACLRHTPDNLSVEQRQNFYYVCRDSLLEANCMYKRLARDDPDRALDIGIQQTRCLGDLKPTPTVVAAMDQCRDTHNVPVEYATLRRRRRTVEDEEALEEALEGSAEPPVEQYESFEQTEGIPEEAGNKVTVADRVNLFIHCVYETIGVLQSDGTLDTAPLIEQLKQFEGDEKAVNWQVDAATQCQDKTSLEAYNMCYYDKVSSACHIFRVQQAFLAGDAALLPEY